MRERTFGAEIEKPITNIKTGLPHGVSPNFFKSLINIHEKNGFNPIMDFAGNTIIGVKTNQFGEQGLDNGFNLQETSIPYQSSLESLAELMKVDLQMVQEALENEGASVINMSIHPLGKRDLETYKAFVAPKGIYPYLWYRGWDHTAGIDARAQNSPTTSVQVYEAARACSVIIGAGAAFIGLFANSPFEEGRPSSYKESRLTMWDRMMKYSKVSGDRRVSQFPEQPFHNLSQYFNWMFGKDTAIHFVLSVGTNEEYKNVGDRILVIPSNPSVINYLKGKSWQAIRLRDLFNSFPPQPVVVEPQIDHFVAMQFAQFASARIRFSLNSENFPLDDFISALEDIHTTKVEEIFNQFATSMWIEGRDPGANFPDQELLNMGEDVAQSVIIAPSAIQAGLIRNLDEAWSYLNQYPWEMLRELRNKSIQDGLQGEIAGLSVYNFASKILEIAARGLSQQEQRLLRYPLWVLQNKANGADRALKFVDKHGGPLNKSLIDLVKSRRVIVK